MEFGACSKNAYVNRKNIKTEERNEIKRKKHIRVYEGSCKSY